MYFLTEEQREQMALDLLHEINETEFDLIALRMAECKLSKILPNVESNDELLKIKNKYGAFLGNCINNLFDCKWVLHESVNLPYFFVGGLGISIKPFQIIDEWVDNWGDEQGGSIDDISLVMLLDCISSDQYEGDYENLLKDNYFS